MRRHRSFERSLSAWALAVLAASSLSAEPQASGGPRRSVACQRARSAAAYVCCDGAGGFAVCLGRPGGSRVLLAAAYAHELDHLSWFDEHAPLACRDRPAGHCAFEMTVGERDELECRGYRVEHRALRTALAGASAREAGNIIARQRTLQLDARRRFGCGITDEEQGTLVAALPE